MDMDFAVSGPLVRRSRLVPGSCPSTRTFAPRFLQTSPRGDSPCVFANPSPPSGWVEDFHLQATEHAQHTTKSLRDSCCVLGRKNAHYISDRILAAAGTAPSAGESAGHRSERHYRHRLYRAAILQRTVALRSRLAPSRSSLPGCRIRRVRRRASEPGGSPCLEPNAFSNPWRKLFAKSAWVQKPDSGKHRAQSQRAEVTASVGAAALIYE
jgi:hypothetical protein